MSQCLALGETEALSNGVSCRRGKNQGLPRAPSGFAVPLRSSHLHRAPWAPRDVRARASGRPVSQRQAPPGQLGCPEPGTGAGRCAGLSARRRHQAAPIASGCVCARGRCVGHVHGFPWSDGSHRPTSAHFLPALSLQPSPHPRPGLQGAAVAGDSDPRATSTLCSVTSLAWERLFPEQASSRRERLVTAWG